MHGTLFCLVLFPFLLRVTLLYFLLFLSLRVLEIGEEDGQVKCRKRRKESYMESLETLN